MDDGKCRDWGGKQSWPCKICLDKWNITLVLNHLPQNRSIDLFNWKKCWTKYFWPIFVNMSDILFYVFSLIRQWFYRSTGLMHYTTFSSSSTIMHKISSSVSKLIFSFIIIPCIDEDYFVSPNIPSSLLDGFCNFD